MDKSEKDKLILEFFECANSELKKKNRFTNLRLDTVVNTLLSENSNII